MNLNKRHISIFFFLLFLVFFMQYKSSKFTESKLPSKTVLSLDAKVFDMFSKRYETDKDFNPYWGFSKEKPKDDKVEHNTTTELVEVTKKEGKNQLCIGSSCYRLLGIYYKNKNASITLYNKDLKNKIKAYTINDILKENIIISDITSREVVFKDSNSTREWHFKIFDVNTTKYKPKEIQK